MLILTHNMGGGTEAFLEYYISDLDRYNLYILGPEVIDNKLVYVFININTGKKSGYLYSELLIEEDLIVTARELKIE